VTSEMSVGSIFIRPHMRRSAGDSCSSGIAAPDEPGQGLLVAVEVAALVLDLRQHLVRVHEGPVAEHDHMLAIIGRGISPRGVDHQRAVVTRLLLQPEWLWYQ
jgi:hypothetical protein